MPLQGASIARLVESHGPAGFYHKLFQLIDAKKLRVDDISYLELAEACGVRGQLRHNAAQMLAEASPGASTALFPVVTAELIGRKVIEGYETDAGWIGDQLVTVIPSRLRNQKLAGFTALAGPLDVAEGEPYQDSTFDEKYVTTQETKKGRILSVNEELIEFDQTGEINRRAMALGYYLRQERERVIVRGVQDADAASGSNVYKPSGTGETLYNTDQSNQNYVGSGGSSPFDSAVPLVNWTDIEFIRRYRATQVKDDRSDGTQRAIMLPMRQILVPEALRGTGRSIVNATEVRASTDSAAVETRHANPVNDLIVLSSPFVDEVDVADWYAGDFPRQFVWSEIWPVQTFLQRGDSEARFERDVVLRVKARYYGGLAATDSVHVTKVDGA